MITTDAWTLHAGPNYPQPGILTREAYSFEPIRPDELLAEPLYGCWEANMTHALSRWPIDVCRQRGEDRIVLGNAGVVRVVETGSRVASVAVGDICVLISVSSWDAFGYPLKILAYDAPRSMGVLARRMKLRADQVFRIGRNSRHTLQQWAAFPIRYATAWDNWKVAYGAWRLQMDEKQCGPAHVWAWGGGVSLAELLLAKTQGCKTALIASDERRLQLCRKLGILAIDRREFADLSFDEKRFRDDLQYRKRYMHAETTFLKRVETHTEGAGVSIFIDNIGGPVFRATQKALGRQGVITTCGWKEGTTLTLSRAAECVSRHIHVHTHGARHTEEALRYAEATDWFAPADDHTCPWEEIPSLAESYAAGRVSSYFPTFAVNPE
jgi:NADPH:quinone reductase-like Zn-dependent oxidoreductase